jgi:hypothetical protein
MQTLTLNITRNMVASEIRPGTAILHPETGRPVVVEEVRAALDDIRFMVRVPGAPRRRSVTVDDQDVIEVLPTAAEVERLVHALAVAHRGDVGDDWTFKVTADPLDPEIPPYEWDIYDTGQEIGIAAVKASGPFKVNQAAGDDND